MAGRVKFGHHSDAAVPGIAENLFEIRFGIICIETDLAANLRLETPCLFQVPVRRFVMGAKGSQLRKTGNLQTPRLIVSQMEMQQIELIRCHDVQHLEQIFLTPEITHHVEHEAPHPQIGPVFDDQILRALGKFGLRHFRVECTVFVIGLHGSLPVSIDAQAIPSRRMHTTCALLTDKFHRRNDVSGRRLIGGLKPLRIRIGTFPVQKAVADRNRLVFLSFHLQDKALGRPGMARQGTARISNGERLAGSFRNIQIERRPLIEFDLRNRTPRNLVVVIQFLKPDPAPGRNVLENKTVCGEAVLPRRALNPGNRRVARDQHGQHQGQNRKRS